MTRAARGFCAMRAVVQAPLRRVVTRASGW